MSVHPSLKSRTGVQKKRSVLKRYERVDILRKKGLYKEGHSAWGLPKTKPE